jgi:hypothetical protein
VSIRSSRLPFGSSSRVPYRTARIFDAQTARWLCAGVLGCALLGCAADVYRAPTQLTPAGNAHAAPLMITQSLDVTPSTGYTRALKAGSVWTWVGNIPQGAVYKIQNDVFTLEGAHVHEAYCVVAGRQLVGFYLPVEGAFAPLPEPLTVNRK